MKLNPVDISKTASASAIVYDALRKAIIEGDLEIGQPLRQDEIARIFNTSRIPVREAISRLEEQGLVRTQRYKGAIVAGLSTEEAGEIFDFRALIEPQIIRTAVPLMQKEDLQKARASCEAFFTSDDPMRWGDLNREFHSALYSPSALSFHLEAANKALDRIERYLRAQILLSDGMELANREHLGILEACESGNVNLAAERTFKHVVDAKASLLQSLKN